MIRAQRLVKHYSVHAREPGVAAAVRALFRRERKTVKAVDEVSFEVADGERVGFLGPNGAGKTTTLKMLAGVLHPTSGTLSVGGFNPTLREDAYLRSVAMVAGQKQQLNWDLPPTETFELNRAVYDISREDCKRTVDELTALLDLGDVLNRPVRQLSLGERMKCELVAALIHRPKVLFLDEPTIGLDVAMQSAVRGFLIEYNRRHGATVLLTSHAMDDVSALCTRLIVIDKGKLSYDGPLDALVARVRPDKRVTLRLTRPVEASMLAFRGATLRTHTDAEVSFEVSRDALGAMMTEALATLSIADLRVEDPPLEEVLAALFARAPAEAT